MLYASLIILITLLIGDLFVAVALRGTCRIACWMHSRCRAVILTFLEHSPAQRQATKVPVTC